MARFSFCQVLLCSLDRTVQVHTIYHPAIPLVLSEISYKFELTKILAKSGEEKNSHLSLSNVRNHCWSVFAMVQITPEVSSTILIDGKHHLCEHITGKKDT